MQNLGRPNKEKWHLLMSTTITVSLRETPIWLVSTIAKVEMENIQGKVALRVLTEVCLLPLNRS